jgi:hypothetical protein
MNSFVGKIHLSQDKLMSVEMWYVDATPWCSAIRYADLFVSLAEGVSDFDWSGQFQPIPSYPHISGVWPALLSSQFQLIPA